MPEQPEVDMDQVRETVHEEIEREGGAFLRGIAVSTALLAALAAVAALEAGGTANDALLLKTESTRLQAQASDQWAYYQAKGIKLAIQKATADAYAAAGRAAPARIDSAVGHYAADQAAIQTEAQRLERERDARSREADALLERHHHFADAVALVQVAIALGAIAALTRWRLVWFGSLLLGVLGLGSFVMPWLH